MQKCLKVEQRHVCKNADSHAEQAEVHARSLKADTGIPEQPFCLGASSKPWTKTQARMPSRVGWL